ncbi:MAG: in-like serine protease, partial [Verrucomicrobiaceae bacterium]|nr:in-like serine protease [Verrucomicrobiaceae bacterium]
YTARGGGGPPPPVVARTRSTHAGKLRGDLQSVGQQAQVLLQSEELASYREDAGINLELRSAVGSSLHLEPLDSPSNGIVLKNAHFEHKKRADGVVETTHVATVFVKEGKLDYLTTRVENYAVAKTQTNEDGKVIKKDNAPFITSIESIGLAAVEAFWTSRHPLPAPEVDTWWEMWIRAGASAAERTRHEEAVLAEMQRLGIIRKQGKLVLPEHSVFLVKTSLQVLGGALALLNFITELRHPLTTAAFFMELPATEQRQWAEGLQERITLPGDNAPAVCVLDTGVNRGHPLLSDLLHEQHWDTARAEWGKDDHYDGGHGTLMAGMAAYGDLTDVLESNDPVELTHWLESVKILPRLGANEPEIYGAITQEAMAIAEANAPERTRVFALAVTAAHAENFPENGRPSAWSSAIDSYSAGADEEDEVKRLICVSGGNAFPATGAEYPSLNALRSLEDPAQSWNALTIGACTHKDIVTNEDGDLVPELTCMAARGGLSPHSTTACLWTDEESKHWPLKPDVVLEGGNLAYDATGMRYQHDSLDLLSTHAKIQDRLFTPFRATSAATAQAARMAAMVQAKYPSYWPETVRALMIHSAEWTSEMKRDINMKAKGEVAHIIRRFGHGQPDLDRALASASNRATLICQDSMQPYQKLKGKSVSSKDMMVYRLPWPKTLLHSHGDTEIRLRVTLSYFIEPNPGSRMVKTKYRYAGCNLRFLVQTATESMPNFFARVSANVSEEDRAAYSTPDDSTDGWIIGEDMRCRGSLHSDTWTGTAAKFAQMEHLIVYPVNGWWRLRPVHRRFAKRIRYALVITAEAVGSDLPIYAPIEAAITSLPISI